MRKQVCKAILKTTYNQKLFLFTEMLNMNIIIYHGKKAPKYASSELVVSIYDMSFSIYLHRHPYTSV